MSIPDAFLFFHQEHEGFKFLCFFVSFVEKSDAKVTAYLATR